MMIKTALMGLALFLIHLPATLAAEPVELKKTKAPSVIGQSAAKWSAGDWINLPPGKTDLNPDDFKGKVIVLYCFQFKCPGCHKHGFPKFKNLYDRYAEDKDVAFVAIQTPFEGHNQNTPARLQEVSEKYELPIPFGHCGKKGQWPRLFRDYRGGATPWIIFIDKKGVLRLSHVFSMSPDHGVKWIEHLKAEKPDLTAE